VHRRGRKKQKRVVQGLAANWKERSTDEPVDENETVEVINIPVHEYEHSRSRSAGSAMSVSTSSLPPTRPESDNEELGGISSDAEEEYYERQALKGKVVYFGGASKEKETKVREETC